MNTLARRCLKVVLSLIFILFMPNIAHVSEKPRDKELPLNNGVNVILHEDFRMPVVIVGIIYHTGAFDAPLRYHGISDIIAANFISQRTHAELLDLGISYEVNVHGRYTEILAKMNPKRIKKFFQIIHKNDFILENFEILKKQITLNKKLAHICFDDVITNEVSTNISYKDSNIKNVFNEKILSSITTDDVKWYFEKHYRKCRLSLIVSGAINQKDLLEALHPNIGKLSPQPTVTNHICTSCILKEVCIESKHVDRSIRYFYKIPQEDLALARAFFRVFHHELFRFFEKANQLIFNCGNFYIISNGDCIRQIILRPRPDVSLVELQRAYDVFVERIYSQEIPATIFSEIQQLRNFSEEFSRANLYVIYGKMRDNYLNRLGQKEEILDSKSFIAACKKFLKSNLILKIITRYKPDK